MPPFVAILRRWRPLLAGIHELTSLDGQNPLIIDDRALAADALPLEVILYHLMLSPFDFYLFGIYFVSKLLVSNLVAFTY